MREWRLDKYCSWRGKDMKTAIRKAFKVVRRFIVWFFTESDDDDPRSYDW
jgi:hypothetical protein